MLRRAPQTIAIGRSSEPVAGEAPACSSCGRTPLPGELVHRSSRDQALCALCFARVPDGGREGFRGERVHASHRHLAVRARAA